MKRTYLFKLCFKLWISKVNMVIRCPGYENKVPELIPFLESTLRFKKGQYGCGLTYINVLNSNIIDHLQESLGTGQN